MAEIALAGWLRAGDFKGVLEFGAVNLHHRVWVMEQRLAWRPQPPASCPIRSVPEKSSGGAACLAISALPDRPDRFARAQGRLILRHDASKSSNRTTSLIASLPDVERDQPDFHRRRRRPLSSFIRLI